MSNSYRTLVIAMFSLTLIGGPAMASPAGSPAAPLGVVLQAGSDKTGADITYGGSTVYDGDRLKTNGEQTLRVRLGGPQMVLRSNTAAQVHALPNGFSADLTEGTVLVSSNPGQSFEVMADGTTIRPKGADPVIGQVTRVNATELVLTTTRGTLEVSMGEEVKTVEAGHSYRLDTDSADPAPSGPGPTGGPYHTARNGFELTAIAIVVGATAVGVWRALVSTSSSN